MSQLDLRPDHESQDFENALLLREEVSFKARARRETFRIHALQAVVLMTFLFLWWAASGTLIDSLFLSDPISILKVLYSLAADGTLWWHLERTLIEMSLGYVFGVAFGLSLGISVASLPWAPQILRPIMLGLFAIPKVALAPLIIVWFGIYLLPKVVLSASLVVFVVYFNTVAGILAVDRQMIKVLQVMGAKRIDVFTKFILPSALPYIFTAMRITAPGALIGAIIGEFLSSNRGIGYLISAASSRYDTARVLAGILSLLIFVLILNAIISQVERYLSRWKPLPQIRGGH